MFSQGEPCFGKMHIHMPGQEIGRQRLPRCAKFMVGVLKPTKLQQGLSFFMMECGSV